MPKFDKNRKTITANRKMTVISLGMKESPPSYPRVLFCADLALADVVPLLLDADGLLDVLVVLVVRFAA